MKHTIAIIRHVPHEGPGHFKTLMENAGIQTEIFDMNLQQVTPSPNAYDAVLVMGGPDSANDDSPKMRHMRDFVRRIVDTGAPFLGICLGMQLLARVCGATVQPCPKKEIGCLDVHGAPWQVKLNKAGHKDPLISALPDSFPIFHLHGETVIPGGSVTVLAESETCPVQIIRVGTTAYGIQGHPEMTESLFDDWKKHEPWMRQVKKNDFLRLQKHYETLSTLLINRWLELIYSR